MIDLLIADDHTMFRAGLRQLLEGTATICIRGEARDGEELLCLLKSAACDVVLLDLSMPGKSGLAMIREIRSKYPLVRILVMSMHDEQQYIVEALRAGAAGYITKASAVDQLLLGLEAVSAGRPFVSASASLGIIQQLCARSDVASHDRLTGRERQIFRLLVKGQRISIIADELGISVKTASTHKKNILEKMNFATTAELIRYALQHGLTD